MVSTLGGPIEKIIAIEVYFKGSKRKKVASAVHNVFLGVIYSYWEVKSLLDNAYGFAEVFQINKHKFLCVEILRLKLVSQVLYCQAQISILSIPRSPVYFCSTDNIFLVNMQLET